MNKTNCADHIILNALNEDIGTGDITTLSVIPESSVSSAEIIAKEEFILAGISFAKLTFSLVDKGLQFRAMKKDGVRLKRGDVIAKIKGSTRSLLLAERTALNILQRMSGIASITDKYVQRVKGLKAKIVDTRKTAPGLRYFDKYAVRAGGGYNHRFGLFDGVLIKDNHIAAAGGVAKAVKLARSVVPHLMKIEVEVKDIKEVKEALAAGAEVIMLDNMSISEMKRAVVFIRQKNSDVIIEASGNVTLENVRGIAETGVDLISAGALTHSAAAADISMKIKN